MLCWGISRNWLAPWVPSCPFFLFLLLIADHGFLGCWWWWIPGCHRSWILFVLVAVMDSFWIMVELWFFYGMDAEMDLHWNWCRSWTFFVVFGVFYFFTGWKTKNFVVAANVRGLVAKQSIISCYSCSILIIAMIWKFHHFRTYIVHLLLQEKPPFMLFLREELYCLFTSTREDSSIAPSRGVILLGHFYKEGARHTTCGPYTGGQSLKLDTFTGVWWRGILPISPYKWGCYFLVYLY